MSENSCVPAGQISQDDFHEKLLPDLYCRSPYQVTTIESFEMDCLLKSLITPAHHALYTIHHAFQKCTNFGVALSHCQHLLKANHSFVHNENACNSSSGGAEVNIAKRNLNDSASCARSEDYLEIDDSLLQPGVYFDIVKQKDEVNIRHGWSIVKKKNARSTKKILQRLTGCCQGDKTSERGSQILRELHHHLFISLGTDVREGAADIALALSMIPICNQKECLYMNRIMDALVHVAGLEIQRRQAKISRRSVEILMIVEKLAAAGCQGNYFDEALNAARVSLPGSVGYESISKDTLDGILNLNFFSPRSLLWLWRKGHVFHKVSASDSKAALSVEEIVQNPPEFDDPSLPLIIDVGCGLGVTLIGLAAETGSSQSKVSTSTHSYQQLDLDWTQYNYLGSDFSRKAMQWATSLTMRRGLGGRCQFLHASTETLLKYLNQTSADIKMILLQFPTPYRLQENEHSEEKSAGCNQRLPLGPNDPSFMANPVVLQQLIDLLTNYRMKREEDAYLLLQSNCEDVALSLHHSLLSMGLEAKASPVPRKSCDRLEPSSRTKAWLDSHIRNEVDKIEDIQRAVGYEWSSEPLIPVWTETEASCDHQGTPVHRCVFKSKHPR